MKLQALRRWMEEQVPAIDAYLIPTADPHQSEYIAPRWQCREWLTGFTGSAGLAVVTRDKAALWTDSRYWLQAETELAGSAFILMRDGESGVPSPEAWIAAQTKGTKAVVSGPADMISYEQSRTLTEAGLTVAFTDADAFDAIWTERPTLPAGRIDVHDESLAGTTAHDKLSLTARLLTDAGCPGGFLFNDLSDIAWLLNLRGCDVTYNPVFYAYLYVSTRGEGHLLFTHSQDLSPAARRRLESCGVEVKPYEAAVSCMEGRTDVGYAPSATHVFHHIDESRLLPSVVEPLRAVKHEAEQEGFREAMRRDGVAMVQFMRWMDEQMEAGATLTEVDIDEQLTTLRAAQDGFEQPSFATIAGYGPHGAIVHYEATPETAATLRPQSLLLLDSGGQYDCGTTDITRTLACGPLSDEERRVYTLVLKGHLALSRQHFPEGTTGIQLDLAARSALWNAGYDFGHGTGHGVGAHLCVHEGPHQIRKNLRACTTLPLRDGMTVTNEPGVYVEGRFGVRIENVLLVKCDATTAFGSFMRFETLTLCPYDLRPVDLNLLTADEKAQINDYHQEVRRQLLPRLDNEQDRRWLTAHTEPLALD